MIQPVGYICEAAPISLFWATNGFDELPEQHLEFPLILIGKSTMTFLTLKSDQSQFSPNKINT